MAHVLFVCLHNAGRSQMSQALFKKAADGRHTASLRSQPEQIGHVEFAEFRTALVKLPPDQREALVLVGASGFSYEEAAEICGCAVGTIKSRLNRARTRLAELMEVEGAADFGPDAATRAILTERQAGT